MRHGRLGAALLACGLALVLPTAASATHKHRHHLELYKVERHVDLQGAYDPAGFQVKCRTGDHALDGMWRIDHVDQEHGVPRIDNLVGVHALWSYNAYADYPAYKKKDTWTFGFEKHPAGKAQLKLFVTCLGAKTAPNGHRHGLHMGGTRAMDYTAATGQPHEWVHDDNCPSGRYLAVAPGFRWGGSAAWGAGAPAAPPAHGATYWWSYAGSEPINRRYGFVFKNAGDRIEVFQHCLRLESDGPTSGSHHTHDIVDELENEFVGFGPGEHELQLSCGDLFKGLVGGFHIPWQHTPHVWYLGMDPRIKTRAFRFANTDSNPYIGALSLLCLRDRVSYPS